ncbi:hypothetical protein BN1221_02563c [Brenneria goodwinii]|uniref:Uncharacterized protein n=1 Tax=Brenneria goodwinii TaxID=1109412 RepID=A0A0G4JWQ1_9GAMM|nr:hypothetical protein BN1221_02563c [Brenneria goodwinii]
MLITHIQRNTAALSRPYTGKRPMRPLILNMPAKSRAKTGCAEYSSG